MKIGNSAHDCRVILRFWLHKTPAAPSPKPLKRRSVFFDDRAFPRPQSPLTLQGTQNAPPGPPAVSPDGRTFFYETAVLFAAPSGRNARKTHRSRGVDIVGIRSRRYRIVAYATLCHRHLPQTQTVHAHGQQRFSLGSVSKLLFEIRR